MLISWVYHLLMSYMTKYSMQELLDMGLPEPVLSPIRKTVLRVGGVEVLNTTFRFI